MNEAFIFRRLIHAALIIFLQLAPIRCAAAKPARLLGFGTNYYGALGDSKKDDRWIPTAISDNVVAAGAGNECTFFITGDGSLWATGANDFGQLGDGTTTQRWSPVKVASDVIAVSNATNGIHTVFIKSDGSLWGMGYNSAGQLGIPDHRAQPDPYLHAAPEQIATSVVSAVASGEFTLFVKTDGSLWATGFNSRGQLGDGTRNLHRTPVQIASDVAAVAANEIYSVFIKRDGTLWGMGDNVSGQFGRQAGTFLIPVLIASDVKSVAAGSDFILFVKHDRTLWGLGQCHSGVFDNGSYKYNLVGKVYQSYASLRPFLIATDVDTVAAARDQSFYIKTDGTLWAAGYNFNAQIGDGATYGGWRYGAVQIATNVEAIYAGDYHALYLGGEPTPPSPLVWFIGGRLLEPGAPYEFPLLLNDPNLPASALKLTARSSDQSVLPDAAITFGGAGNTRTVRVTPVAGLYGITAVTVSADNGQRTGSMTARVEIPPLDSRTMFTDSRQTVDALAGTDIILWPKWYGNFPPSPLQWEVSVNGGPWTTLNDDAHHSRTQQFLLEIHSVTLAMNDRAYRLTAGTGGNRIATQPYQLQVFGTGPLTNISSRAYVGTGDAVAIAGFVIRGPATKRILIRNSGPALGAYGITNTLMSPVLQLVRDGQVTAFNAGWSTAGNADEIESVGAQVGAFPWIRGSADAGVVTAVSPAGYSAVASGASGTSGVALLEVYDADGAEAQSKIVNISTRAQVATGDGVLIAGVTVTGNIPKKLFLRVGAQALTSFGIKDVLPDPVLELYRGNSLLYSSLWGTGSPADDIAAAASHVGAFTPPPGTTDPAIVLYLAPGAYTTIVRSKSNQQGIALLEAYDDD